MPKSADHKIYQLKEPIEASLTRADKDDRANEIHLQGNGDWLVSTINSIDTRFRELETEVQANKLLSLDMSNINNLDTAGAWLIQRMGEKWRQAGGKFSLVSPSTRAKTLFAALEEGDYEKPAPAKAYSFASNFFYSIGKALETIKLDTLMGINILGEAILGRQFTKQREEGIRLTSIVHHIDKMGLGAVPIIILMSFFIGAIVAQQAAFQLRIVGLESIAPDWVGAMLLREICVLLTAVMIAGRSGSAMTAEIGSMKMREEIDSLKVIGLNPVSVLVLPRLAALTISMFMLTIISNFAGLTGAAVLLYFYSDLQFLEFANSVRNFIDLETILAGLIKAPFMGLIIGVMAAVEGMKVQGSAGSLGRRTTASVVKAIFFVIVVDGLFAVFYAAIDY
ncbi:MAG: ABC transporter permease [Nitratireductor sp.]